MANANVYGRLTDELQVKSAVYSHPLPTVHINHRQYHIATTWSIFCITTF